LLNTGDSLGQQITQNSLLLATTANNTTARCWPHN